MPDSNKLPVEPAGAPTCLVVGDSGVIGSALVQRLSDEGWRVFGAARGTRGAIPNFEGPVAHHVHFNVDATDPQSLGRLRRSLEESGVQLDLLALPIGSECHEEDYRGTTPKAAEVVEQVLVAPLLATGTLIACLRACGLVVFYSGGGALHAPQGGWNVSYAAAKAGLHRAVEALALQLKDLPIWTTIIDPGWIPAEGETLKFDGEIETMTGIPRSHLRRPEDAAEAVVHLFRHRGESITGRAFSVQRDYRADIDVLRGPPLREDLLLLRLVTP